MKEETVAIDANLDELDMYIDMLYEEKVERKIAGAKNIMMLTLLPEGLEEMLTHESLLGVLKRTLGDEHKKNIDLTIYLLGTFLAISNYIQFHDIVVEYQIGNETMKVIDYQIKRGEKIQEELMVRLDALSKLGEKKGGITNNRKELELDIKKFQGMIKKQDKLFCICFSILFHLADNITIERKMMKRNIVTYLVKMLERNNIFLLICSVSFLKKLSVFDENKEMMKSENIVPKLLRFLVCQHNGLKQTVLRLIYNLTFDSSLREAMDKNGYIPKLVEILKIIPAHRALVLKILYQLSQDDKTKATFIFTDCIPLVYQLIIHFPQPKVGLELVALAINLSTNSKNAAILGEGANYEVLIKRAFKNEDVLLFKVIRNIAQFATAKMRPVLEKYSAEFIKAAIQTVEIPEIQIELLGTLVYTNLDDWAEPLKKTGFLKIIEMNIDPSMVFHESEDVLLECIMLAATVTNSEEAAIAVARSEIPKKLGEVLLQKDMGEDITLQILYTINQLMLYKETKKIILSNPEVISEIIEQLGNTNMNVRKQAELVLDIVQFHSAEWANTIRIKKFQVHNQAYLQVMEEYERMAANAEMPYMEDEEGNLNEILWYDSNELGDRIWANTGEPEY